MPDCPAAALPSLRPSHRLGEVMQSDFPDFGLTPEQRRLAVRSHYYEWPGMDGERGEIWCYTDRFSYRAGETVTLACQFDGSLRSPSRSSATAASKPPCSKRTGIAARWQDTPDQCSVEGCGWDRPCRIPRRRRLAVRRLSRDADGRRPRRRADPLPPSFHRPARRPARNQAACCRSPRPAPGSPTTPGAAPTTMRASPARTATSMRAWSSTQRPWCRGFVVLPPDAPRVPLEISRAAEDRAALSAHGMGAATGHSKKYASSGWASYDSHFFRWAERAGYRGRSRQPARSAFRPRAPRRLRLRRLRRP